MDSAVLTANGPHYRAYVTMQKSLSQHIITARTRFPRGLEQPEGSLRFGADALLLAAFAARGLPPEKHRPDQCAPNKYAPDKHLQKQWLGAASPAPTLVAELGCGCGAALLGLAMLRPHICGLGLEREHPLVQAAVSNAVLLGLSDQLHFASLDLTDGTALSALRIPAQWSETTEPEAASSSLHAAGMEQQADSATPVCNRLDAVLANPPYDRGGRPSAKTMREHALRGVCAADGHKTALDTFCRAAATLLRHQGRFFCIYDAPALPRLCVALNAVRLGVRRILPVQSHRDEPALRVLVEARKSTAHDTVLETPLVLHDTLDPPDRSGTPRTLGAQGAPGMSDAKHHAGPFWSAEALAFCPWLGVADAPRTAATVSPPTADNAFHRIMTKSRV